MSASIYAEPLERKKHYIPTMAPQNLMDTFQQVFGARLPKLGKDNIRELETLIKVGIQLEALDDLIDYIEKVGDVQLSAEY